MISCVSTAGGIYRVYKTIRTIELTALRPARTVDFAIGFGEDKTEELKIRLGQDMEVIITASTGDCDVENFCLSARFPNEFEIEEQPGVLPEVHVTRLQEYTSIVFRSNFLTSHISASMSGPVKPTKTGAFEIPVTVQGKGISENVKVLMIRVTK